MSALTTSHWIPDGSGQPLLEGATVGSRLREVAAEVPDRVALVEGLPTPERRQWTYARLLADAECCARLLLQYFQPGERVAAWAHNLPEWVLLEYGAALAGLTLVTVNPSLQPAEGATSSGNRERPGCSSCPPFAATRWWRTPRRSAPTCRSCDTSCVSICSTN
jgi:fatty-acyl-CoA synthase